MSNEMITSKVSCPECGLDTEAHIVIERVSSGIACNIRVEFTCSEGHLHCMDAVEGVLRRSVHGE